MTLTRRQFGSAALGGAMAPLLAPPAFAKRRLAWRQPSTRSATMARGTWFTSGCRE